MGVPRWSIRVIILTSCLARRMEKKKKNEQNLEEDAKTKNPLPSSSSSYPTHADFYPVQTGDIIYDVMHLKVITQRNKTGFEETKDFPIQINSVIAGRYQILEFLGSAAFSKAVQCLDLATGQLVCIKIINNNKDFFDQSLDEIKLLEYIGHNGD